ncbi:MAG: hypothetical protein JXK07_09925 [Spirochaetes bacterium]|nr:hypothetical protein [Spirochaetota bacterium]MBN2771285.1 hypothetical protein [Spirochaetota bacterium]
MTILLSMVFRLYLLWGRVYRFFRPKPEYELKPYNEFFTFQAFFSYIKNSGIKKYSRDSWYQLGDVISHPLDTLTRGFGDCDDYAATMSYLLPDRFSFENKNFTFLGMFALVYSQRPHHIIAVWFNDCEYFVISTKALLRFKSWNDLVLYFDFKDRKVRYFAWFNISHYSKKFRVQLQNVRKRV